MKNLNAEILADKKDEINVDDLILQIKNSVQFFIYELKKNIFLIETFKKTSEVKLNSNLTSNDVEIDDLIQAIESCDNFTIFRSKKNENNLIIEVF